MILTNKTHVLVIISILRNICKTACFIIQNRLFHEAKLPVLSDKTRCFAQSFNHSGSFQLNCLSEKSSFFPPKSIIFADLLQREMEKLIYDKIDKTYVNTLPRVLFDGRIIVINTAAEAEKAVDYLLDQSILGVDTETRPSFKKGCVNVVALLQVSTHDTCFLFRLNLMGITPAIKRLLEDTTVPKIGLSLHDDILSLHRRSQFEPGNFIDLQKHVCELGVVDMSLQKIYANLFHGKISKNARLSNWEADVLSEKQKMYAAIDAWACIVIYEELMRLEQSGDYRLVSNVEQSKEAENV